MQKAPPTIDDQRILSLLKTDAEQAMDLLFQAYYPLLVNSAYHVLMDEQK